MFNPEFFLFLEFSGIISVKRVMSYQFHNEN